MEFPFNINHLFSERFSILDKTLVAGRMSPRRPELQSHIATVIDELGRASAKAQKLTTPVTSATKMQSQHHQLYLMKDGESQGGRGAIVGFLKVGYKKLFLLDPQGLHVEAEPLCVLDFFITENLQRHGHGLELFHFMLQHKKMEPALMAYDRPSPKLLSFLAKHYRLTQSVPQVNNFVVFDGFFHNKSVAQPRSIAPKKPDGEIKPYSIAEREAVRQERRSLPWPFAAPQSPQRSLSVGSSPTRAVASAPGLRGDQSPNFPLGPTSRERRPSQQGQVARDGLYSRHLDPKSLGALGRPLPGVRSAQDQPGILGATETHRCAASPRRPAPEDNGVCGPTSLGNKKLHLGTEADAEAGSPTGAGSRATAPLQTQTHSAEGREREGIESAPSHTGASGHFSAQQVKRMLSSRATCPW
ncbi:alpha-tubulin N-acetyltransferase 1 isoform X2 [Hippocampus comes]|uniref:alpha-tubulin N-acetyltransferase 1 isoform X2 n=1 Tax=Hippocampus comes TaxID=109280 RepID=UPI00094F2FBC|nr:PREDICTED: alpha-tubulin N-acetyltransferase 1 isoform X2 [Hippocampus comes]